MPTTTSAFVRRNRATACCVARRAWSAGGHDAGRLRSVEASDLDDLELIAGLRNQRRLRTPSRSRKDDLVGRQSARQCKSGVDVTGRSATRDDYLHRAGAGLSIACVSSSRPARGRTILPLLRDVEKDSHRGKRDDDRRPTKGDERKRHAGNGKR